MGSGIETIIDDLNLRVVKAIRKAVDSCTSLEQAQTVVRTVEDNLLAKSKKEDKDNG